MGTMVEKSDKRTFALILLAQFCSLLGQEVLQFVLPLYLLDVTGSGARFGLAIACGFVPYTLLSPIGGVLADRTRKRGIMMGVNAALVAVLLVFLGFKDTGDPFSLVVFATMASFVAQALYQPSIQSTVPFVLAAPDVPRGVALVSQIGSLTTLSGPVVGAAVYGAVGLVPVVWVSLAAFAVSGALVALAVRFPCEPASWEGSALAVVRDDLAEAVRYLRNKPILLGGMATATFVNVSAGALISVGTVYVVTITLGLPAAYASFAQMSMGAGSLVGHSLLAIAPRYFSLRRSAPYVGGIAAAMGVAAWALSPVAFMAPMAVFLILTASYAFATMSGGLMGSCMLAELQAGAPSALVGKLIALFMTLVNCATPLGQAVFGVLFDVAPAWLIALATAIELAVVTVVWRHFLRRRAS
ncbi:MFS transporter [Collinsella sp. BA40]|uniref:MFS transporter n=1 Tax=Collinsella sp. BA40 TaxID=2560852 RepID=UPI0011C7412B|nr:MFS transporter [Collinsella sp. BA40]TXF39018.1 MFS transporter [Collinsella sp. BA40]